VASPGGDPADAAALVAAFLRLAVDANRDAMIALAGEHRDRPELLGAVVVLLGAELARMRMDALSEAIRRFDRVT
jgi:N-formylglutamate amidohydrolase